MWSVLPRVWGGERGGVGDGRRAKKAGTPVKRVGALRRSPHHRRDHVAEIGSVRLPQGDGAGKGYPARRCRGPVERAERDPAALRKLPGFGVGMRGMQVAALLRGRLSA